MRLTVENLACRRAGRRVFEGLGFALHPGEALLVRGRNGAGKSSLLAILAGNLRPDAGRVLFEGAGVRGLPECLHLVGHRDGLKGPLTAEENLAFAQALLGDPGLAPREALARVGLDHAAGLPVAYLSAGQRRRVALARLLVARRPLWLLDEPTSALDAGSQAALLELMRQHLSEGGMIFAATHQDLDLAGARELALTPSPLEGEGGPAKQGRERGAPVRAHREAREEPRDLLAPRRSLQGRPLSRPASAGHPPPQGGREGSPFRAVLRRDLALAARVGGSGALGLVFFLMLVTLVPFALGPDLNLLSRIGPAILWLAAVLATLIGLDRLFQADDEDGSLDLLRQAPAPMEFLVLAKALAHWLTTGLPLALAAPLFGLLVALTPQGMGATALTLLAGTPALTLLGAAGAALTTSIRRGGLILAVLVAPLMIPTLIFGVAAAGPTAGFATPFLVLCALSLASAVIGPLAAAAALRSGGS